MRAIDFYACIEKDNPFLKYDEVCGLVGTDTPRFAEATEGELVNIETMFQSGLLKYGRWPTHLTGIYNKIYDIN
jgi:hypothetical protein